MEWSEKGICLQHWLKDALQHGSDFNLANVCAASSLNSKNCDLTRSFSRARVNSISFFLCDAYMLIEILFFVL